MQMTLEGLKAILDNPQTVAAITEKTEFEFIIQEDGQLRPKQREMMRVLINKYFDRNSGSDHSKYEFKKLLLQVYPGFVSVYIVVGMKGDEGTMAEIFARDKVHAFVHIRGGLKANGKVTSKSRSKTVHGLFEVTSLHH